VSEDPGEGHAVACKIDEWHASLQGRYVLAQDLSARGNVRKQVEKKGCNTADCGAVYPQVLRVASADGASKVYGVFLSNTPSQSSPAKLPPGHVCGGGVCGGRAQQGGLPAARACTGASSGGGRGGRGRELFCEDA
jgi:hypothetical protein